MFFFISTDIVAQVPSGNNVSDADFQKLVEELEYDKSKKTLKLKDKFSPRHHEEVKPNRRSSPMASGLFSIFAYGAVILLVAFIVYLIFSQVRVDKKLDPLVDEMSEIEDIDDIDAESDYKVAIASGNYRLAIRMQFIKFLQLLSTKEKIHWEREKTNRDYHRELEGSELKRNFRELASIYEKVWYGEEAIDSMKFRTYDQRFFTYLNKWR